MNRLWLWLLEPKGVYGPAVARILIGAAGVHYAVSGYAQRYALWGPASYVGRPRFSLHTISSSPTVFNVLFHAGIAIAVAYLVLGGRLLGAAHAALTWSLYQRNPVSFDGGDVFGRIVSILLVLCVTNAAFAPGARRRREQMTAGSSSVVAHNLGAALIVAQLCIVYLSAGLMKVRGSTWREGTALFFVSQLEDYQAAPWTTTLYSWRPLVTVVTYSVMALEIGFVLAIRTRLRTAAVVAMSLMHLGIAVTLGLVGFVPNFLAGLAVCLPDRIYARVIKR